MNYGHLGPKHNSPQDSSDQVWQDNSQHTVSRKYKYCNKDKSLHMTSPIFLTIYRRRKRGGGGGRAGSPNDFVGGGGGGGGEGDIPIGPPNNPPTFSFNVYVKQ